MNNNIKCPKCNSKSVEYLQDDVKNNYKCLSCAHQFFTNAIPGVLDEESKKCIEIDALKAALLFQGIKIDEKTTFIILETYKKILSLGANFSLKDVIEIELTINEKYLSE